MMMMMMMTSLLLPQLPPPPPQKKKKGKKFRLRDTSRETSPPSLRSETQRTGKSTKVWEIHIFFIYIKP